MICPKCRAEMPEQATYCLQCGASLNRPKTAPPDMPRRDKQPAPDRKTGAQEHPSQAPGDVPPNIGGFRFDPPEAEPRHDSDATQPDKRPRFAQRRNQPQKSSPLSSGKGEWIPPAGYASPAQRLGAFIVDFVLIGAAIFFLTFLAALLAPGLFDDPDFNVFFANVLPLPLTCVYYVGMESSRLQATPGKIMLGIKVVDFEGKRAGLLRTTVRYFAKTISSALFFLGFLMILFTKRRQGLHDMMAGCLVVRRQEGERVGRGSVNP